MITLSAETAAWAVDTKFGGGVTRVNAHLYRVCCPVHGGGDRNLAIKDGDAVLPLVECHSRGCDRRAILRLICEAASLELTIGRRKLTSRWHPSFGRALHWQQRQN